jgi:hypothetical protein
MFSEHERQLLKSNSDDTPGLTRFKMSVYNIFVSPTQSHGLRMHVIKAQADDIEPIVLLASGLYLNDTTHSIVAKVYMHPYIHGIGPPKDLGSYADATINFVVGKEALSCGKKHCQRWLKVAVIGSIGMIAPSMTMVYLLRLGQERGSLPCVHVLRSMGPRRVYVLLSFLFLELRIWKNCGFVMTLSLLEIQWPN